MRHQILAAAVVAVATASGCTVLDPYTGEEKTSKATKQAAYGAAAGTVAGLITGDSSRERRKHALIGAGVGALTGAAIGHYMDRQEAKLREQLVGTGVQVVRDGDNLFLVMPGNITFKVDRADLNADFYEVMNSVVLVVNEFDKTLIEVTGHTDSTGSDEYNQRLSERRAESVERYLQAQGVVSMRIDSYGMGERYPVADNATSAGRQQNRRVELALVPITS